ncbi:uncharacterized protein LOC123536883 [Mercenaria mercenaria]|uniref:uncharacterized protein LOC123536883 n=1 Tax=Mercenaria mercenaria TaxID=6596 RepID=UPI00234ED94F|nr:uncharacterized protein LOC123536883 [Mercenaria mercenaria]XP_053384511.1 uncharacterized protein LOC123536883 [Mercenaria mercenaria]
MAKWLNSYQNITRRMKQVLVYEGPGMYEIDTKMVQRVMKEHVNTDLYQVDTVSPLEIVKGRLAEGTALLVIGGGYDLGLIKALGQEGMTNIKDYVNAGGSYLGICSGAYFACDRIEFDKYGPLEVLGERFLKFYSGTGIGPLFKPYDYQTRKGASAANVDFCLSLLENNGIGRQLTETKDLCQKSDAEAKLRKAIGQSLIQDNVNKEPSSSLKENGIKSHADRSENTESQTQQLESQTPSLNEESQSMQDVIAPTTDNGLNLPAYESLAKKTQNAGHTSELNGTKMFCCDSVQDTFNCKVYFNGGCYFRMNSDSIPDGTIVLSHYLDLPNSPAAILRCQVGAGVAVLSGAHLEYDAVDIDDGDDNVTDIIPCLRDSAKQRRVMIRSVLQQLNIVVREK